jgi:hypothetical protein
MAYDVCWGGELLDTMGLDMAGAGTLVTSPSASKDMNIVQP